MLEEKINTTVNGIVEDYFKGKYLNNLLSSAKKENQNKKTKGVV